MNELQVFNFNENEIRTTQINGEPYFIGKDVCEFFGDSNHNRTISRVDNEDKQIVEIEDSLGRMQKAVAINESGLYSILFSMQPQKANDGVQDAYPIEIQNRIKKIKRFKRWVTYEVLPSIRKHGAYMTDQTLEQALTSPDFLIKLATELKDEQEKRKALEAKNTSLAADNQIMKPKVLFADAVECSHTSILVGDLAKLIKQNGVDIGQQRLFAWLRNNGYLMKHGNSKNMPTQTAMDKQLFEVKERTISNPDGSVRITKTTAVTGKGQIYFVNKFCSIMTDVNAPVQGSEI